MESHIVHVIALFSWRFGMNKQTRETNRSNTSVHFVKATTNGLISSTFCPWVYEIYAHITRTRFCRCQNFYTIVFSTIFGAFRSYPRNYLCFSHSASNVDVFSSNPRCWLVLLLDWQAILSVQVHQEEQQCRLMRNNPAPLHSGSQGVDPKSLLTITLGTPGSESSPHWPLHSGPLHSGSQGVDPKSLLTITLGTPGSGSRILTDQYTQNHREWIQNPYWPIHSGTPGSGSRILTDQYTQGPQGVDRESLLTITLGVPGSGSWVLTDHYTQGPREWIQSPYWPLHSGSQGMDPTNHYTWVTGSEFRVFTDHYTQGPREWIQSPYWPLHSGPQGVNPESLLTITLGVPGSGSRVLTDQTMTIRTPGSGSRVLTDLYTQGPGESVECLLWLVAPHAVWTWQLETESLKCMLLKHI